VGFAVALFGYWWGGCAGPLPAEPVHLPVLIEVDDEAGGGLPGAQIVVDGREVGDTSAKGHLVVFIAGVEGGTAVVAHVCPPGYEPGESGPRTVVLRRLSTNAPGAALVPEPVTLVCRAIFRQVVLLVRAQPPSELPVTALGRAVASTDANGVAQVLLRGRAGEELEITLDTSAAPRLRPVSPTRRVVFADRPQLLVFDQIFEEGPPRRRALPRPPRRL
jgi:hypothetical protein